MPCAPSAASSEKTTLYLARIAALRLLLPIVLRIVSMLRACELGPLALLAAKAKHAISSSFYTAGGSCHRTRQLQSNNTSKCLVPASGSSPRSWRNISSEMIEASSIGLRKAATLWLGSTEAAAISSHRKLHGVHPCAEIMWVAASLPPPTDILVDFVLWAVWFRLDFCSHHAIKVWLNG